MHDDSHHKGLAHDLDVLTKYMNRRRMLGLIAGAGALSLFGCGDNGTGGTGGNGGAGGSSGSGGTGGTGNGTCSTIPEETAGPYPGDGSNGPNILTTSGIVRSDIRSSIGSASGVADGVVLTVELTVVDASCAPVAGYAVYLWHCDRAGNYSMYSAAAANENYLRGVQETDSNGKVTFTSIFPGCYSGRWPHIHFEVYPSLQTATNSQNKLNTSQLALPKATCDAVYATSGYSASVSNLAQISLSSDNVFREDSAAQQLATMSGSVAAGYLAALTVAV